MSVQGEKLKEIADAIRSKTGKTEQIKASDFANEILNIQSGSSEPTQYGAYNIEVVEKDDGTQELHITDADEKPFNFLQWKCDNMKSLSYEFSTYNITNENGEIEALLKGIDTSNVTNMSYMFNNMNYITKLDLSSLDTSNVTNMSYMFGRFHRATNLNLSSLDTNKVIDMSGMFYNHELITELDLSSFDTSSVTNMGSMFYICRRLKTILGSIDLISITNMSSMFTSCMALETVTLKNIKRSLQIGSGTTYGTLLNDPTVINTAKELWDLTGTTSQKLTVSTPTDAKFDTIYVKLITATDEMITNDPNIIYKKPCEVCASTDEGAMTLREYIVSKNWTIAK